MEALSKAFSFVHLDHYLVTRKSPNTDLNTNYTCKMRMPENQSKLFFFRHIADLLCIGLFNTWKLWHRATTSVALLLSVWHRAWFYSSLSAWNHLSLSSALPSILYSFFVWTTKCNSKKLKDCLKVGEYLVIPLFKQFIVSHPFSPWPQVWLFGTTIFMIIFLFYCFNSNLFLHLFFL